MSCRKETTKKYVTRPGPPFKANSVGCKGTTQRGNDGARWKSTPDKLKRYTWRRVSGQKKTRSRSISRSPSVNRRQSKNPSTIRSVGRSYVTLDNGGQAFFVKIQGKDVIVSRKSGKTVHSIKNAKKIFIGKSGTRSDTGNSILVNTTGDNYEYIGEAVKRFRLIDGNPIKTYLSPVGNSAVPYPFGLSSTYAYLMVENKVVPQRYLKTEKDPYYVLYQNKPPGILKFSMKTLVKRN